VLYIKWHMLASYYKFTVKSAYMPISVPVSACSVTKLACHLQYIYIYMPAHECQVFLVSCQVSLYVNLSCYMMNCCISVSMPNALFHMLCVICQALYAECYGLYAKLYMLDWNMSNAMTIAMYFSMTIEQVGYLVICIYYPAMTLHIAVTKKKLL
jgi:hypothetical protein